MKKRVLWLAVGLLGAASAMHAQEASSELVGDKGGLFSRLRKKQTEQIEEQTVKRMIELKAEWAENFVKENELQAKVFEIKKQRWEEKQAKRMEKQKKRLEKRFSKREASWKKRRGKQNAVWEKVLQMKDTDRRKFIRMQNNVRRLKARVRRLEKRAGASKQEAARARR